MGVEHRKAQIKAVLGYLIPVLILLFICCMAMNSTEADEKCARKGGHLEFSDSRFPGYACSVDQEKQRERERGEK